MKIAPEVLNQITQASEVRVGNIYPAKGGRKSPGTEFWLVVALRTNGAVCLGLDAGGEIVSATTYLKSAMRERPVIGKLSMDNLFIGMLK